MILLGYILTLIMGISLGLIGGGGSILTVPILVYFFNIPPTLATAYSLFIVGLTALIGGGQKMLKGAVDIGVGTTFAIPGFIGVFLTRAYVMPSLPDVFAIGGWGLTKSGLIMLIFAIMMILASFSMLRPAQHQKSDPSKTKKSAPTAKALAIIALEGLVVGGLTGFVGAGGGFLIIPALVVLAGLPMNIAVGTSLLIIAVKSLLGFLGDVWHNPNIDWQFLLLLSAIATVGIFIGSFYSDKVPERQLKRGFAVFVLIMGSVILFKQL